MKPPICLLLPVVAMTLAATFAQDTPKVQSETKGKDKTASQAKALPKSQTDLIPGSGENRATPPDLIKVMPGFEVELLYSVPSEEQGSWVALCLDDKGRFYVGDQYGGLYRFLAPPPGQAVDPQTVEKVPAAIRGVNGLHFADGVLFANVNDNEKKIPSGFYKVTDSDGDDRLDRVELLREMNPGGDHGLHGIVPVPDSDDLYLICGNRVAPTEAVSTSPMLKNWGEDQLLPRMPDGRGHNRHVLAPGGMIYRVSRDGKRFSLVAGGFRNIYDAAVNSAGELFTFDSDMEWDMNTPWYRPTRLNHVISGGEFGWRNGAGKRPEFYADNLPATLNIGPGSPTGTTFGYGAKFPAKYQKALFGLDWSWGKIYAIHLEAKGASYTGTKEEFISGTPLPVTDVVIRPQDGAMYFTIGGRRVQSGFYRVTYIGGEDASPAPLDKTLTWEAKLRRELEAFHIKTDPEAVAAAWPHLAHPDRYVRWAARMAIEHQPLDSWKSKALSEADPEKQLGALLALCRAGGVCPYHRVPPKPLGVPPGEKRPIPTAPVPQGATPTPPVDTALRGAILDALLTIDFRTLSDESKATLIRIVQITLNRFDGVDEPMRKKLIARLDPAFPAKSFPLNWLLCETLAYLQSPTVAAKGIALIQNAPSQEEQIEFARSLRFVTTGWTKELRTVYLEWFLKAANYRGGASFEKFIEFIRHDALSTFTEVEKTELAKLIAKKPERISAIENLGAVFAGRTPTNWTLEELSADATGMKGRDFGNGRKMFSAAACYACHRFRDGGGMIAPDLTGAGGRYSAHDLLDNIINPSKVINEQFVPVVVTKKDGQVVTGVVVNLNGDKVQINTDLTDPNQQEHVDRKDVKSIENSKVSPMPPGLLNLLKKDEILDLLAYVLSGGNPEHEMFDPSKRGHQGNEGNGGKPEKK